MMKPVLRLLIVVLLLNARWLPLQAQAFGQIENKLIYVESSDPGTIDPITSDNLISRRIVEILFGGLYTFNEDRQRIPEFAIGYPDSSADYTSCVVHLRPGQVWSDGHPFTAEDVYFTYLAATNPESDSPNREIFNFIRDMQVVDSLTLRVEFIKPVKAPEKYLMFFIAPKHKFMNTRVTRLLTYCRQPVVSNGGYVFKASSSKEYYFERNPHYQLRGKPKIESISLYIHPDQRTHVPNLVSGLYNLVPYVPPANLADVRNNAQLVVTPYSSNSVQLIALNCQNEFLQFREVRRALNLAIDRASLLSSFYLNNGELLSGPFPPMHRGYNPDVKPYPYAPGTAKQILADLGFRDQDGDGVLEKDGKPFRLRFLVPQILGDTELDRLFKSIAEQIRQIGVDVEIRQMVGSNFDYLIAQRDFDMAYYSWYMQNQASPFPLFVSQEARPGGKNIANFVNPLVDSLLYQAEAQPDLEFQTKILQQLHKIIFQEAPWVFLWHLQHHAAYYRYLKGVSIEPFNFFTTVENWYIDTSGL
ncbi:MAG: hypothetical protein D6715_05920 [Calditrichaeota bacterium]|nr:MAG: hypothetical protein D6715_05920 [Calditrichota bacterium]